MSSFASRLLAVGMIAGSAHAQCDSWRGAFPSTSYRHVNSMVVFDPDGPGPRPDVLVIGGDLALNDLSPHRYVAMYDGAEWHEMGGALDGPVSQMVVWRGELIVAGLFATVEGRPCRGLASWNGDRWMALGEALQGGGGAVSVATAGDDLYVVGDVSWAGGVAVSNAARFDGAAWHALGTGLDSPNVAVVGWGDRIAVWGTGSPVLRRAGDAVVEASAWWDGEWHAFEYPGFPAPQGGPFSSVGGTLFSAIRQYLGGGYGETYLYGHDGVEWTLRVTVVTPTGIAAAFSPWEDRLWKRVASDDIDYTEQAEVVVGATGPRLEARGGAVSAVVRFRGDWVCAGNFLDLGGVPAGPVARLSSGGTVGIWPGPLYPETQMRASDRGVFVVEDFDTGLFERTSRVSVRDGDSWSRVAEQTGYGATFRVLLSDRLALLHDNGTLLTRVITPGGLEAVPSLDGYTWRGQGTYLGDIVAWGSRLNPDGSSWLTVGIGTVSETGYTPLPVGGPVRPVWALQMGGMLVVGGYAAATGNASMISRWDGESWATIDTGNLGIATVHRGELHVLTQGAATSAGRVQDLRVWDGAHWRSYPGFMTTWPSSLPVGGLASFDSRLYAYGSFSRINGAPVMGVGRWDGTVWEQVGEGLPNSPTHHGSANGGLLLCGNRSPAGTQAGLGPVVELIRADVCPSDLNCDGGTDGADIEVFFVLWERASDRADLNVDGSVDGADVEAFFVGWEAGC